MTQLKTSIIEQIAKENNANYVKLNLAQITETAELIGYPCKEHYVCKSDECKWITSELVEAYARAGWEITEHTRMSYAIPQWLVGLDPEKPLIFCLDDWSRASNNIIQSVYEILSRQEFISWKLPKNTTVLLSANPDNGEYTVTGYDEAAATRMVTFNVRFDINAWAEYAEYAGIDSRAINFLLSYYHELMKRTKDGAAIMNARSYTMFANIIGGIKDWSKSESLAFIMQIASGCFLDKENIVGGLFTTFVHNNLDKLISPEDLLLEKWETVQKRIRDCVYKSDGYHPEIASILHTRLLNYSCVYLESKDSKTDVVKNRLLELIDACDDKKTMLFSEDLIFHTIRALMKKFPGRCNPWMMDKKIQAKLM